MWRAAALTGCTATTFSGRLLAERSCLPSLRIAPSICLHPSAISGQRGSPAALSCQYCLTTILMRST